MLSEVDSSSGPTTSPGEPDDCSLIPCRAENHPSAPENEQHPAFEVCSAWKKRMATKYSILCFYNCSVTGFFGKERIEATVAAVVGGFNKGNLHMTEVRNMLSMDVNDLTISIVRSLDARRLKAADGAAKPQFAQQRQCQRIQNKAVLACQEDEEGAVYEQGLLADQQNLPKWLDKQFVKVWNQNSEVYEVTVVVKTLTAVFSNRCFSQTVGPQFTPKLCNE